MTGSAIFIVVSTCLIYVSRKALLRPRSHGFTRFFAWEFIAALVVLNFPHWVSNPFSLCQLASWVLLLLSIVLAVHGAHLLRVIGKPDQKRTDAELLAFEKTSQLVTVGAYTYIRHPLIASLLFLAWGAYLKHPTWVGLSLALVASTFLVLTAQREEAECLQYFGAAYQAYMLKTKRFVPFLF